MIAPVQIAWLAVLAISIVATACAGPRGSSRGSSRGGFRSAPRIARAPGRTLRAPKAPRAPKMPKAPRARQSSRTQVARPNAPR